MILEIFIGLFTGILFGVSQIVLLHKVVKSLTDENGGGSIFVLLLLVQIILFVAILVVLGFYSLIAMGISGVTMALTALVVWIKFYRK